MSLIQILQCSSLRLSTTDFGGGVLASRGRGHGAGSRWDLLYRATSRLSLGDLHLREMGEIGENEIEKVEWYIHEKCTNTSNTLSLPLLHTPLPPTHSALVDSLAPGFCAL